MNLPNQITIGRLVLSAILFFVLDVFCRGTYGWVWYAAFTLYMVTVLSDGLDGYLARSRGQITVFGRIADPLADKIVITGILVLGMSIPETTALVPAWIVILVLAREFLVSGLRAYIEGQGVVFGSQWAGKTKLVVQAVYCGAIVFYPGSRFTWVWWVARVCLVGTALISIYSAGSYLRRAQEMLRGGADI